MGASPLFCEELSGRTGNPVVHGGTFSCDMLALRPSVPQKRKCSNCQPGEGCGDHMRVQEAAVECAFVGNISMRCLQSHLLEVALPVLVLAGIEGGKLFTTAKTK